MIVIDKNTLDTLNRHASQEAPREACGVLAGKDKKVERIYECRNTSAHPETNYELAPEELLRAIQDIEGRGLEVLGFYHSHPMGLDSPSFIDEGRATWPGYSYVIVSLAEESSISSWKWDEAKGEFEKEEVVVR